MSWQYITDQEGLNEIIPTLMSKSAWAFDTETTGLDPIRDRVTLIQIGDEEQQFIIDARKVNPAPLKEFFESQQHFLYGHNLKFDYKMMKTSFGIECERLRCTYLTEKILTAGKKFNGFGLGDVLKEYLDVEVDKSLQKSFAGHTGDFSREQLEYAMNDIKYLLQLKKKMMA
jgi:ribonuclease D